MSLPDLTGQNIENTYQRLVQTDGTNFYDGTGSLVILPSANTASLLTTASAVGNTITFTKGNASQFSITVDTGSGGTIDTSSLVTTSSFNAFTSSINQFTSSYNTGSFSGSFIGTASWANNSITASYVLNAISSSFASTASYASNGGVTQILAGSNITLSPTNGLGQVTISSTGGGGVYGNTATGSYGSFYDTTTQTNPVANVPRSMSFNSTDITNGVSISGSTNPFNTYVKVINAGVYNIQFSAQVDKTDSGADEIVIWLRKNGIDLTDTATTLTLSGNNDKQVAAWNWFVSSAAGDYYQIIWVSADTDIRLLAESISGTHPGIPSVILTVNRVDQFLSNTGSFTGSFTGSLFGTSSWATNALTASYVQNAQTASYVLNAVSASYVQNAQTSSHLNSLTQNVEILGNVTIHGTALVDILVTNYQSSSIIYSSGSTKFGDTLDDTHEFTGSIFTTGSISSTNTVIATTGSFSYLQGNSPIVVGDPITFQQAITASSISASIIYGNGSNLTGISSSSFSTTSSFTPNAIVTASATPGNYTMRLTKGDGSFFDVTLTTPAPTPPPVTNTGSFFTNATLSSDRIVFTKGDRSSLDLSLTSSYILINQTSSFVLNSQTSSMLEPYVLTSVTSSMLAPYLLNSQTSSIIVLSSSLALTASFTPNAITTASAVSNTITFTKGSGDTFSLAINTGSGATNIITEATAIATIGGSNIGSRIARDWSTTGPTLTAGRVVYLSGSTQWAQAQANTSGSSYGMLGVVTNAESQNEILIEGTIRISGSALSGGIVGQPVYLSAATAGQVSLAAPTGSGQISRVIGYVYGTGDNVMYFRPDNTYTVGI